MSPLPAIPVDRAWFESLPEYSCSIPTGVYPGRQWRCRRPYGAPPDAATWFLGWYAAHADPKLVYVRFAQVTVLEEP